MELGEFAFIERKDALHRPDGECSSAERRRASPEVSASDAQGDPGIAGAARSQSSVSRRVSPTADNLEAFTASGSRFVDSAEPASSDSPIGAGGDHCSSQVAPQADDGAPIAYSVQLNAAPVDSVAMDEEEEAASLGGLISPAGAPVQPLHSDSQVSTKLASPKGQEDPAVGVAVVTAAPDGVASPSHQGSLQSSPRQSPLSCSGPKEASPLAASAQELGASAAKDSQNSQMRASPKAGSSQQEESEDEYADDDFYDDEFDNESDAESGASMQAGNDTASDAESDAESDAASVSKSDDAEASTSQAPALDHEENSRRDPAKCQDNSRPGDASSRSSASGSDPGSEAHSSASSSVDLGCDESREVRSAHDSDDE